MANITLSIGGRDFMLACADGEEDHIRKLGAFINAKVHSSGAAGQTEPRMLLFAALMMADELHEVQKTPPAPPPSAALHAQPSVTEEFADRLSRIAVQVENLADLLETEAANA